MSSIHENFWPVPRGCMEMENRDNWLSKIYLKMAIKIKYCVYMTTLLCFCRLLTLVLQKLFNRMVFHIQKPEKYKNYQQKQQMYMNMVKEMMTVK